MICEIKSGFDIDNLRQQIKDRITLIRDCMFVAGEKPEYFIGIVNLLSENVNKLDKFVNNCFEFNENILIVDH